MAIVLRCGHKNNTPYFITILTSVNRIAVIIRPQKGTERPIITSDNIPNLESAVAQQETYPDS